MALRWTNKDELDREFKEFEERYNRKSAEWMCRLGEQVVKYARENGNYTDRTANLRNSIGYMVVQSGKVIADSFKGNTPSREKGGDIAKAHQMGLDYAKEVIKDFDGDKTYLVWVAGMEYAAAVEAKGYDVIEGSGNWVESQAQKQMESFKRFLLSKR